MSFVFTAPEMVTAAAGELAGIRSALGEATAAAAGPTTGVLAAGADEVSAAISQVFGSFGQEFQALSAQAAVFHDEFVSLLNSGAAAYLRTEAANAAAGAPALLNDFGATVAGRTKRLSRIRPPTCKPSAAPYPLTRRLSCASSSPTRRPTARR
ncbi:hypothetical protein AWC15_09175 [Mycobacterium lacus]|nr:PE family protein [Mycobacterium lacus]MCV7123056.1 PE family protein [Mycobacterium lacus]ORW00123.1 hypothetical protein AWC15_09175 [Mycobacterium lacus]